MKAFTTILLIALLGCSSGWAQTAVPKKIMTPVRADTSAALREMSQRLTPRMTPPKQSEQTIEVPMRPSPLRDQNKARTGGKDAVKPDPAWQQAQGRLNLGTSINFEGLSDLDNENVNGFRLVPPDPNGDVGPNHYVQMINTLFAVYDKAGNQLLGPLPNNALWAGFGGPCEFDNDGDPIVLYDPLADRWLLTQFTRTSGFSICLACSETPDPTGAYYRYEFPFDDFPDYPKYGVWPDAYYATFRVFGEDFDMVAAALEREKMLVGDSSAQIVLFSISDALAPTLIDGVLPVDLDGPPPPEGTPGLFLGHQDDAFTGAEEDRLVLFELSVDWDNLSNTTFDGPTFLPTDSFDIDISFVPQPDPGEPLTSLSEFMMYRLAFRNFGTHMSMVTNHTVDVGDFDNHAGIRWYELRNEGSGWDIFQQGTYAPTADHRWMGSIAMDGAGNIALGYSVTNNSLFPSIRYTGRTANAPLGEMNIFEQSIIEGTGAQLESFNRWGDYTMMAVDPTDESTFWFTNEYYDETSEFNFKTRIAAFDLEPLPGAQIQVLPLNVDFGLTPVGEVTGPITISMSNVGDEDLIITDISDPGPNFSLSNVPSLPLTIPSFSTESFEVIFNPTTGGNTSAVISINSNDADDPVIEVVLEGEGIDFTAADALIWDPTATITSQQVVEQAASNKQDELTETEARDLLENQAVSTNEIADALNANGVSSVILTTASLPSPIPSNLRYLFVVLGQFPANFVILDGSPEALTIIDYINNGGNVYMEGGDTWFYDPQNGGYDFNTTFGIEPVNDGASEGELMRILGSNIAEGIDLDYNIGTDSYPDHINPTGTGFLIHTNINDSTFNCGVANSPEMAGSLAEGRTVGVSFEFGQLIDGDSSNTKAALMSRYLDFFDNGYAEAGIVAEVVCPGQIFQGCPVSLDIQIDVSESPELLGSFTGSLMWNPDLLEYIGDSGIQSGFIGLVNNQNADEGRLVFNGAKPSGAEGQVQIITVEFNVIGDLADSGMLDLEFSAMNAALTFVDLLPDVAVNDCSFTINESTFLLGDLNGDQLVNSADALICLSYDAGIDIPEEFEARINAGLGDVNGDMVTNSADCLIILTYDVGTPVPYPVGEPVCPKSDIPIAQLQRTYLTASLGAGGQVTATAEPVNNNVGYGNYIEVPVVVTMQEVKERLGSFTATLEWDPEVLQFEGFTGGSSNGFSSPVVNTAQAGGGKITFAHAQVQDTEASVNVLNVKFKAIGEIGAASQLDVNLQTLTAQNNFYDLLPLWESDPKQYEAKLTVTPEGFGLGQNFPNPFSPETEINYQLPESGNINLSVYTISGQLVRVLINREATAGSYTTTWDGRNHDGEKVGFGTYILRMVSGDFVVDRKMIYQRE